MSNKHKNQFWIVFDTCTRAEYYADLHRILALPCGYVTQYEYRQKHFARGAWRMAQTDDRPTDVLLVYAQWHEYRRGDDDPPASVPFEAIHWVPTRLAKLQSAPPPTGGALPLHLKLGEYPALDDDMLRQLLKPLHDQESIPFHKWVCLSDAGDLLAEFRKGAEDANWLAITERLSQEPFQFHDDAFWRLSNISIVSGGKVVVPVDVSESESATGTSTKPRQLTRYVVQEGRTYKFDLISMTPLRSSTRAETEVCVNVAVQEESPLKLIDDRQLRLRPHGTKMLRVRVDRRSSFDRSLAVLSFSTRSENDTTFGPSFDLEFDIRKPLPLWAVIFLFFLLALCSLVLTESHGIIRIIAGAADFVILAFIYSRFGGRIPTMKS